MCTLNKPGSRFAQLPGVKAMTDVTGFGLLGHLIEMADGSGLTARLNLDRVPLLPGIEYYLQEGCVPGGTQRNFDSYGHRIAPISQDQINILCDPQTSGGLLIAVEPAATAEFLATAQELGLTLEAIGEFIPAKTHAVEIA